MIVSLAQLDEFTDRARIYFVLLDQELSLQSNASGSHWSSTQIGIWASKGQLIAVQNHKFIPGTDTTQAEVVPFHQAYLVKPDLSGVIRHQHKSKNGFLMNIVERRSLSTMVKRNGDAMLLPEGAPLDQLAERLMEGRMTLQQLMAWQTGKRVNDKEETLETGLIELVIIPRGVLIRPLKEQPVLEK